MTGFFQISKSGICAVMHNVLGVSILRLSTILWLAFGRRVWRYQRGNQNPYIEEEQTVQWPNEKVQKDKQRSKKYTHKTKDRVTRTQLKTGCELRCPRKVYSSCSTSGTRRVNLVTNPVISHEWGKDQEVFTTTVWYFFFMETKSCCQGFTYRRNQNTTPLSLTTNLIWTKTICRTKRVRLHIHTDTEYSES